MALIIGFLLVAALGIAHQFGLRGVRALKPNPNEAPQRAIAIAFLGLLALHMLEIVAFAAIYRGLLHWGALGSIGTGQEMDWGQLVYFSGMNFATLGYTQIETSGPIRLVSMMQSLGEFMVLTWSATFLYTVSERAWRE